jgi:sugar phosphate isomerase/epimerase
MIQIGIRSSIVTGQDDSLTESHLLLLKKVGFNLIELSFNCAPLNSITEKQCESLRLLTEKLNFKCTAHAPDTIQLSSPELEIVNDSRKNLEEYIHKANLCGARTLVFHACPYLPLIPGKEDVSIKNLTDALEYLKPLCESKNVRLAIETMVPGRITSSIDNILRCVNKVNSPFVGICIDTNHVNLSMPLKEAIEKAAGNIFEFHLNDNHLKCEEHLLPFQGLIDWDEFIETVSAIGFNDNMIMEPSLRPGETLEVLLQNAGQVRRVFLEKMRQF